MKNYYQSELNKLKSGLKDFENQYPEHEPNTEDLLEGVAYLNAQLQKRLDDNLPEISESLLSSVAPHLLEPFPSRTIIQFTPRFAQFHKTYILPKGTSASSSPVGDKQINCHFKTLEPLKINPIEIMDFSMSEQFNKYQLILKMKMVS